MAGWKFFTSEGKLKTTGATGPAGTAGTTLHSGLTDVTADQHHAQAHSGADHTDPGTPTTQAFGDAAAAGTGTNPPAADDHKHGMPANPVTAHEAAGDPHPGYLTAAEGNAAYEATGAVSTHAAAGDPHTGYRLESADHTHATTGLQGGTVAHSDLTGLTTGDPHTQYALDSDLTTHAGAADPHTGYRLESADHTHATTGLQGGTVAHSALTGIGADDHHARQHSSTSTLDHTFPGGTTTFLRADGTYAAPTAAAADPSYSPGSFTVVTETGRYIPKLQMTTTQRATLEGTGRLIING